MFEYAKKKISSIFKNHEIIECTIGESNSGVYKVITPLRNYYLKIQRINVKEKLEVEASIYGWLKNKKIKIPEIKYYEKDNLYEYLVLTEIQGLPSFDMVLRKNKKRIIEILASTLIDIHNIKIDNCRFKRKKEIKLKKISQDIYSTLSLDAHNNFKNYSEKELWNLLQKNIPDSDDLVFTHGDYCLPNIIIDNYTLGGVIDIGRAGIADRYTDLALIRRSLRRNNFTEDDISQFFEIYGIKYPDEKKLLFYEILDEYI